jgi:hypothetical protein
MLTILFVILLIAVAVIFLAGAGIVGLFGLMILAAAGAGASERS